MEIERNKVKIQIIGIKSEGKPLFSPVLYLPADYPTVKMHVF